VDVMSGRDDTNTLWAEAWDAARQPQSTGQSYCSGLSSSKCDSAGAGKHGVSLLSLLIHLINIY
jgi:hypothetical protein